MIKIEEKKKIIGERLRAARKAAGFKGPTSAARNFGWNYNTYKDHEAGKKVYELDSATKYAKAFKSTVNHLLANDLNESDNPSNLPADGGNVSVVTIPLFGPAAGGLWLEGEMVVPDDDNVSIPADAKYPAEHQYARKVIGDSVSNRVANGEYAIFVHLKNFGRPLTSGLLVDCLRTRSGLYEHSIKVYDVDRLLTDSKELDKQISIPLGHTDEDATVRILGVAISAHRPLI